MEKISGEHLRVTERGKKGEVIQPRNFQKVTKSHVLRVLLWGGGVRKKKNGRRPTPLVSKLNLQAQKPPFHCKR